MTDLNLPPPHPSSSQPLPDWLSRPLVRLALLDWEKISYVAIVLLAVVSRFWGLGDRVVSHDESLHTQYSFQYYNGDGYVHTPLMHGPFLFHVTALTYWLFGHNDLTARIPVAILGVFLVIMPYFMRQWIGRRGAVFASFILLISPYVTYYSRYIRHDVYVIVWALIVFIATWHYIRNRDEKSLWWFAGGLALMFSTKEVSFIYTAIFGSFLIVRLLAQLLAEKGFWPELRQGVLPLAITGLGLLLAVAGAVGLVLAPDGEAATGADVTQPLAVDPTAALEASEEVTPASEGLFRWGHVAGLIILSGGLFMVGRHLRRRLDHYPEFDIIILYVTLLLPVMTAYLVQMTGRNPTLHDMRLCVLAGQESMSTLQLYFYRLISLECWGIFLADGLGYTLIFMIPLLAVSVAVGLWWHSRRWVIAVVIFQAIFLLLHTSLFTNPGGWLTGTIDALGYWLDQQEVQRGSQPYFYYAVVMPLYEFFPLLFAVLAIRLWSLKHKLLSAARFWFWTAAAAWLAFGLVNWAFNRTNQLLGEEQSWTPGLLAAAALLGAALLYWFFLGNGRAKERSGVRRWGEVVKVDDWIGFFPSLVWWLLLTAAAYTYAGEKMPWLSIHFVIPMAFMVGWYANERLREFSLADLASRRFLYLLGLTVVFLVAIFLAIGPAVLGQVRFGDLQAAGQFTVGRFFGSLLVAAGLAYGVLRLSEQTDRRLLPLAWTGAVFTLLAILTIRFTYMANFPNGDYVTEYMVYAHGAPATKADVMPQLEELSLRLYGDMNLKVHYDNETSWPYTWYLRNFTSRSYFGQNPTPSIRDADAVLVGDVNYARVQPFLGDDFDYQEFTYLWWPMEDYRRISWATILGTDPSDPTWRGLFDPAVRQAVWDIFFYRDYTRYGEVTDRNFNVGSWPLRRTMRLYVNKEAKALLWDRGVGATVITAAADPYAEGELPFEPATVFGQGELVRPRNLAVAPDGIVYVADSGNHRIAVYDQDGNFQSAFGEFGPGPGQFNEPWGLAVDEEFVYVADTWNHRVQKLTRDGRWVADIGRSGTVDDAASNGGLFFGPRAIVLLNQERLMITDTGNHRLQLFDRDGNFLETFGGIGALPGEFYEPVGLAAIGDGSLLVADTWNERIQEFPTSPPFYSIANWNIDAWDTSQSIDNKPYLAADSRGRVYVTDPEGFRVLIFDRNGLYLGRFGDYATDTSGFALPTGIAVDGEDNIYVVDANNGRVLKFRPPLP